MSPDAHLTETHALNSRASALTLLSEWSAHWNQSRPLLLEKTPTNMLTSRLLQALLGPGARFIFITRHPLAVSLAHRRWPAGKELSLAELNLHWLAEHRVLRMDLPHLQHARVLRYEDLTLRTRACVVDEVFAWLDLHPVVDVPRRIDAYANAKQEAMLCKRLLRTPEQIRRFCAMADALQPALDTFALGYDFRGNRLGFECLKHVFSNASGVCDGVPKSAWIVRQLAKQTEMTGFAEGTANVPASRILCSRAPKPLASSNGLAPRGKGERGAEDKKTRRGATTQSIIQTRQGKKSLSEGKRHAHETRKKAHRVDHKGKPMMTEGKRATRKGGRKEKARVKKHGSRTMTRRTAKSTHDHQHEKHLSQQNSRIGQAAAGAVASREEGAAHKGDEVPGRPHERPQGLTRQDKQRREE